MATHGGPGRGQGRKPGAKCRIGFEVKQAVQKAFEKVGGVSYLVAVAQDNPAVFCQLLGKCVPREIAGDIKHEHNHEHKTVSETTDFIIQAIGQGADSSPEKSLPH